MSGRLALWISKMGAGVFISTCLFAHSSPGAAPTGDAPLPAAKFPDLNAAKQAELLRKVRAANEDAYATLSSFLCSEKIDRYRARLTGEHQRQVDSLTANVAFDNGVEQYTQILQRGKNINAFSTLAGAWSEGEFATLLLQTEALLSTQPVVIRDSTAGSDDSLAVLSFQVDTEDSPWDLEVSGKHYRVPFRTELTISKDTGAIQKIARTSLALPSELRISELRWTVELGAVQLANRTWMLPKSAEYAVLYNDFDRMDWNVLTFSNYRRFDVQVSLRFD